MTPLLLLPLLLSSAIAQETLKCWPPNDEGSLLDLIQCASKAYIPAEHIKTLSDFNERLPATGLTVLAMDMLLNGCRGELPADLEGVVEVRRIWDGEVGRGFCVALDVQLDSKKKFAKGWGIFVVPIDVNSPQPSSNLHLQAPHPIFDGSTDLLATSLFRTVPGFRSLLLATRHRNAYKADSTCIAGKAYSMTDPAHNIHEPFFSFSSAILSHINSTTCEGLCGVLQLHGKGASTCVPDTLFLTAGTASSIAYKDHPDWMVGRMVRALRGAVEEGGMGWNVTTPETSGCLLTATRNVVGRVLNGVPEAGACGAGGVEEISGRFAHVESALEAREYSDGMVMGVWRRAFTGLFSGVF
ncbi:hypothetical protein HDU67_004694 [Dinochytrium kinnereticum]|nr:hypothetical protein HDU67_004694 [Dinochytrium kinnereticum]